MWRAICACAASPSRLMSAKRRTCFAINPACSSPPWREIFAADAESKQDFAEAQATYQAMVAAYSGLGSELVTLPLASVAARVRFVLDAIGRDLYSVVSGKCVSVRVDLGGRRSIQTKTIP